MNNQQTFQVQTLKQLQNFAVDLIDHIQLPTVILMSGHIGCGKTQLTKFIVSALKAKYAPDSRQDIQVTSPTFTLRNTYQIGSISVEHFDLFRLKNKADLESTGLWEVFEQKQVLLIVEWADLLKDDHVVPLHLQKLWQVIDIAFFHQQNHQMSQEDVVLRCIQVHLK